MLPVHAPLDAAAQVSALCAEARQEIDSLCDLYELRNWVCPGAAPATADASSGGMVTPPRGRPRAHSARRTAARAAAQVRTTAATCTHITRLALHPSVRR